MSSYQMPATQRDIAQLLRLNAALADPSLLESSNLSSSMKPMQAIAITPQHHSSALAANKQRSHTLPVQAHTPNLYRSRLHSMQQQQQQKQQQQQQQQQQKQQQQQRQSMLALADAPDNQFDLWSTPQRKFDDTMSTMGSTCPDLSSLLSSDAFENFVDPLSGSDQASGSDKQRLSQLSFPESDDLLADSFIDFSNPLSNTMPSISGSSDSKAATFPGADSPNQWEELALRIDVDGWLGAGAASTAATPAATPKRRQRATMHVETAEFLTGKSPKMRRLSSMSGSRSRATMAKTVPLQQAAAATAATPAIPVHTSASQAASGRVTAARVLSASEAKASMAAMQAGLPVAAKKKTKKGGAQRSRKQKRR